MDGMYFVQEGNPSYGHRMKLFSRTGYHLTILPRCGCNGTVIGINDDAGKCGEYQILELSSAGEVGEVRIRGVYSHLYLCMNEDGFLYGEVDPREEGTVFIESPLHQYNTYLSKKYEYKNWYVGIKKNGKVKPAYRTGWGQKAIQFLPLRVE